MQMKFNCNERERRVTGKKSGWLAGRYRPLATPTYHDTVTALCLHIRLAIKKTTHTETPSRQPGTGREARSGSTLAKKYKLKSKSSVSCQTHTHIVCVNLHTLSEKYPLVLRICVLIKYANKLVCVCVWHFRNCKQNSPKKGSTFWGFIHFLTAKPWKQSQWANGMKDDFNFGILNSWQWWWSHRSHWPRDSPNSNITLQASWTLWAANSPGQVIYVFLFISISPCSSSIPRVFYSVSLCFLWSFACSGKSCCKVVATCNTCKWAMLFICHCVLQVLPKVRNLFPTRWQTCAV